jgi:uncharacterized protein YjbJ (UPF0337 family)
MIFQIQALVTNLQGYLKKFAIGFALLTLVWQGAILGVDPAIASPLFATSADSMSKQMTGTAEQIKGAATKSTEAKIKVEANNARVENTADKATTKVKNFFGK